MVQPVGINVVLRYLVRRLIGILTQVRDWLKTKQGTARVTDEIKKRKAIQSLRVGIIDASIVELKVKKELSRA